MFQPNNFSLNKIKFSNEKKPVIESARFKNWFGESKVTDKKGLPLITFHATTADFEHFAKNEDTKILDTKDSTYGFFFTDNNLTAETYIYWRKGYENKSRVIPTYLKIENPYIYDHKRKNYNEDVFTEVIVKARENGHDGVIIKNAIDSLFVIKPNERTLYNSSIFVVFKPNQIKSAIGNNGNFSLNKKDVTK